MSYTLKLVFCLLFFSISSHAKQQNQISVVTEHFPPYQINAVDRIEGMAVDIFFALNKLNGDTYEINLFPWARAYEKAITTPNTLIFTIARTKSRQPLFKWIGDLPFEDQLGIWTVADLHLSSNISSMDLSNLTTAIPRYDSNIALLREIGIEEGKQLIYVNQFEQAIEMLLHRRIDYIAAGKISMCFQLNKLNKKLAAFKFTPLNVRKSAPLSFAFNAQSNKELVSKYRLAFREIKDNGTLDKITNNWLKLISNQCKF
ncbi:substrate-binding periplasmic protein [Thalassotalea marina]|uniref:Solute-binding protein family 3/N-terminal domain-containing protein n=1 Tax=Thalassotalea marina TaxID=1673741 RepID=A0A919EIQ9_9GAMM|nr:transporter substrate-binding domain-containing protein [Thalassotalea marina]GHF88401.1 hypothetical protein GCM10017161_15140 [Thalassotalea marina]